RPMQTQNEAQQGGLAGSVGAKQAQHAAWLHPQRDIIEGNLAVLVNLGELVRLDHQIARILGHEAPSSRADEQARDYTWQANRLLDQLAGSDSKESSHRSRGSARKIPITQNSAATLAARRCPSQRERAILG